MNDPGAFQQSLWAWLLAAPLVFALVAVVVGSQLYIRLEIPNLETLRSDPQQALPQATIVYSREGHELARFYREHRTWVDIDAVAQAVVHALVAVEDRRFYRHRGVDLRRMAAAVWHTARGDRQGGSTITMQLVRNLDPDVAAAPTWQRKLLEVGTALRLERLHTKDELLEMYLNTVPFGTRAFGIEAAAYTYFNTTALALSRLEAATLVAILKGTTRYSPIRHPERARERRNLVLRRMEYMGYLDSAERDSLTRVPLELDLQQAHSVSPLAPHFVEHVRAELAHWAHAENLNPYTGGLRVYTTLDARLQELAQQALLERTRELETIAAAEWSRRSMPPHSREAAPYRQWLEASESSGFAYFWTSHPALEETYIRRSRRFHDVLQQTEPDAALHELRSDTAFLDSLRAAATHLQAGLVGMEPATGSVRVWVGGRDFSIDQYDKVAMARRQPGSTFKPFVYAAALEKGFSPYDLVRDSVITYSTGQRGPTWRPRNAHGTASNELVTLREALARSLNTVTARLGAEVGAPGIAHVARKAGIRSRLDPVPSLSLGTSEATLLELTSAYSTLAANGHHHRPHTIVRIEDAAGTVLASFEPEGEQTLSPHTAHLTVDMLRDATHYGTGAGLRTLFGLQGDLAGKTGTSQHGADGWFVLMHPHLVTGVWVGFNDPRINFRSRQWGQGSRNALPIAGMFFRDVLAQYPSWQHARFTPPRGHYIPPPRFLTQQDVLEEGPRLRPALDEASPADTTALRRLAQLPMPNHLRARLFPKENTASTVPSVTVEDPEARLRAALDRRVPLRPDSLEWLPEQVYPVAPDHAPVTAREHESSPEDNAERMLRQRLQATHRDDIPRRR